MIASDEEQFGVGPAGLGIFFVPDELVGERQSSPTIFDRPRYPGPAALELLALPAKVELAHSRAIGWPDLAGDIRIEPFARLGSENLVLGRIVKIHSASSRPDPCASAQSFLTQLRPGNYAKFDRRDAPWQ